MRSCFHHPARTLLVALLGVALVAGAAVADEGVRAGDKFNDRALRYVKARKPDKAMEYFEKALPYRNDTSDIFYNLVHVAEALKDWRKLHLYATGFLYLEQDTDDAQDIARKRKTAAKWLGKKKKAVVPVTFEVDPPGVQIMVDDVPVARARRTPVELPPGKYTARASKTDHHDWEAGFEVVTGAPVAVQGKLKPMVFHGFLEVITKPTDGVQVFVDDELVGTTPLTEPVKLETRRYLVRFEKEGWDRWIRYVDIKKNETHKLKPVMEQTPAAGR